MWVDRENRSMKWSTGWQIVGVWFVKMVESAARDSDTGQEEALTLAHWKANLGVAVDLGRKRGRTRTISMFTGSRSLLGIPRLRWDR
jgi:hypothetical protein